MAFLQRLFNKKTPNPTAPSALEISAPNGSTLRNDTNAELPKVNGLIHSDEEKQRRYHELVEKQQKAMPPGSEIGSPNNNGLRSDANQRIPEQKGLVRSNAEQWELMRKMVGQSQPKTELPGGPAQKPGAQPKSQQRETKYQPMGQKTFDADRLDGLLGQLDDIIDSIERENQAPDLSKDTRGAEVKSSAIVTTPQQPRQPVVPAEMKQVVAENVQHANVPKPNHVPPSQQLNKSGQSRDLGRKHT